MAQHGGYLSSENDHTGKCHSLLYPETAIMELNMIGLNTLQVLITTQNQERCINDCVEKQNVLRLYIKFFWRRQSVKIWFMCVNEQQLSHLGVLMEGNDAWVTRGGCCTVDKASRCWLTAPYSARQKRLGVKAQWPIVVRDRLPLPPPQLSLTRIH